ncbi:hypothetical protein JJQ72_14665 [Paenibacillus sp. F411]|uniref:Uncharacterized protein n=1 Tax=Paenibacillus algicola TaxID=2565926 RepID=A0A4V1G3L0_9BACL|nr:MULTISPECIES: hypothetical protein [Paenibacillus]MBO2945218.1 hypothetical protein [Paenibacillus sp. F411]QCT01564.1 hypothetical protein E6C60_0843 [Paenibacillus algicola]
MSWSKLKQQLESFLSPALQGKVEYRATSYRYAPDKAGDCYITAFKHNVLNMNDPGSPVTWYASEQEIKQDDTIQLHISPEEVEAVRAGTNSSIPEERLRVMAASRKKTALAKELMSVQTALVKSSFTVKATHFLSTSIEENLESKDILLNILALVDRRVGRKRLLALTDTMKLKHPAVQYFYELRRSAL